MRLDSCLQCDSQEFSPSRKRVKLDQGGDVSVCADIVHGGIVGDHHGENREASRAVVVGQVGSHSKGVKSCI